MLSRRLLLLALVGTACSPGSQPLSAANTEMESVTPLPLYPEATALRLFVNEEGFRLTENPDVAGLTRGRRGVELTEAERIAVSNSISIGPEPTEATACAPTWRHLFVFYDVGTRPLGALAVCFECLDISVIGPAAPAPSISHTRYRVRGLRELVEARGLLTHSDILE
jgi:hypothetical protein